MAFENRIEAWAETPAELSFGPGHDHFWIKVGPAYREAMTIRIHGGWAKKLHESLGEYLSGNHAESFRDGDE